MSLRPFQAFEDFLSSYDAPSSTNEEAGASSDDGSSSVMFSGDAISTDSTTDLTANAPSIAPSVSIIDAPPSPSPSMGGGDYYDPTVTGLPSGAFIEIYREHLARNNVSEDHDDGASSMTSAVSEFGGTIVSSAASGYRVEAPPLDSSWAMAPPPDARPIHRDHVSISTTESMYRELASLEGAEDAYSVLSSLQMSMAEGDYSFMDIDGSDAYSSCTITGQSDESQQLAAGNNNMLLQQLGSTSEHTSHDRASFVNVAERMALISASSRKDKSDWFARFTEQDWLTFRRDADMIMAVLNPGQLEPALLPLPPAAPQLPPIPENIDAGIMTEGKKPCVAADTLPSAFICPLCEDAIVGATTLDCTCPQSTMCMSCWEGYHTNMLDAGKGDDNNELEDLVHVHQNNSCPFCQKIIHKSIACYALDMAILHSIKALPDGHALQYAYYGRLTKWRDEVKRRRTESRTKKAIQRDQLLAELIAQEEDFFWDKGNATTIKQPFWQTHKAQLLMFGEFVLLGAVALLAGGPAARGLLSARR